MRLVGTSTGVGDGPWFGFPMVYASVDLLCPNLTVESVCTLVRAHQFDRVMITDAVLESDLPDVIVALKAPYPRPGAGLRPGMLVGVEVGTEYDEAVSMHSDLIVITPRIGFRVPDRAMKFIYDTIQRPGPRVAVKYTVDTNVTAEELDVSLTCLDEVFRLSRAQGILPDAIDFILEPTSEWVEDEVHSVLRTRLRTADPRHVRPVIRSIPRGFRYTDHDHHHRCRPSYRPDSDPRGLPGSGTGS